MRYRLFFLFYFLLLVGCGFHFRQEQVLPFKRVSLEGNQQSALLTNLRREIEGDGKVEIVSDPKMAEVRIFLLSEESRKEILGYSNSGTINGFRLIQEARFRFTATSGRDLAPVAYFTQRRQINVSPNTALAKESEEGMLYQDMQRDMIGQIILRLSTLNPNLLD